MNQIDMYLLKVIKETKKNYDENENCFNDYREY